MSKFSIIVQLLFFTKNGVEWRQRFYSNTILVFIMGFWHVYTCIYLHTAIVFVSINKSDPGSSHQGAVAVMIKVRRIWIHCIYERWQTGFDVVKQFSNVLGMKKKVNGAWSSEQRAWLVFRGSGVRAWQDRPAPLTCCLFQAQGT